MTYTKIRHEQINSENATDGYVLTSDGVSGTAWEAQVGGAGSNSLAVYGNNAFVVTGTALIFNDNLTVSSSGTLAYVNTNIGAGLDVVGIFDDSTFKVSGTAISFDNGLYVSVTGSVAYVNSSGTSGNGGAPTTATYITTSSNADLSAEVIVPGLAGSPDISGAGGAGTSEEYDTATTGLTWDSAPAVCDSNTTIKSHLYIKSTDSAVHMGLKSWSPAGAFDARAKMSLGSEGTSNSQEFGLWIGNSDNTDGLLLRFVYQAGVSPNVLFQAYSIASSSFTQRGSTMSMAGVNALYLRITRDGSNNDAFFWSTDGLTWIRVGGVNLSITVAKIGYRIGSDTACNYYGAVDWLRTDV